MKAAKRKILPLFWLLVAVFQLLFAAQLAPAKFAIRFHDFGQTAQANGSISDAIKTSPNSPRRQIPRRHGSSDNPSDRYPIEFPFDSQEDRFLSLQRIAALA
jgi:hypothetical protein